VWLIVYDLEAKKRGGLGPIWTVVPQKKETASSRLPLRFNKQAILLLVNMALWLILYYLQND